MSPTKYSFQGTKCYSTNPRPARFSTGTEHPCSTSTHTLAPQARRSELALQAEQAPISLARGEQGSLQASHPGTCSQHTRSVHSNGIQPFSPAASAQEPHGHRCSCAFLGYQREEPLVKEAQGWVPQTPCRCGGGRRLFETSSAAFLICKIGTGMPYLAGVLRRLISICRALWKTKHKAKQRLQPGREAAPGSQARPAPRQGPRHLSSVRTEAGSASHGGDCSEQGRRLRGCDCAMDSQSPSTQPWQAEAEHTWHPPGHASLTKGLSSNPFWSQAPGH